MVVRLVGARSEVEFNNFRGQLVHLYLSRNLDRRVGCGTKSPMVTRES